VKCLATDPAESTSGGFSLVEVLVALVVFEVGFLGVVAMTLRAQNTLLATSVLESTSRAVEWVADSLSHVEWGGPGSIELEDGVIRWVAGAGGFVTVTFEGATGSKRSLSLSTGGSDAP
jgi:hypothetical protein